MAGPRLVIQQITPTSVTECVICEQEITIMASLITGHKQRQSTIIRTCVRSYYTHMTPCFCFKRRSDGMGSGLDGPQGD